MAASSQTPPSRRSSGAAAGAAAAGVRDSQGLDGSPSGGSFRGLDDEDDESEDDLGASSSNPNGVPTKLRRKLSSNLFLSGASKSKFQTALSVWSDTLDGSRAKAWEHDAAAGGAQHSAALHSHNERALLRAAVALDQPDGDSDVVDMSGLDADENF